MKQVVTVLAVLGLLASPQTPAWGERRSGGGFCDLQPGLCAGIEDLGEPAVEAPVRHGPLSRFYWRRIELDGPPFCSGSDGRRVFLRLIDRVTNEVVSERFSCPDPTTGALPPLPPVPPPPIAVWNQVPLPAPEVRFSPPTGLTGLEAYLWYDQPTTAQLTVDLEGFTVTIDAHAARFHWRTGDGAELTSGTPGTPGNPAARHVYETKGEYTLTVDVTWTGTYTFSGPGIEPMTVPLGERTFTGQVSYLVSEIRGVRR